MLYTPRSLEHPNIRSKMRSSSNFISSVHPTLNFAHQTLESFVWNNLIRTKAHSPLSIFKRMRFHGVAPDFHTLPFVLHLFNSTSHLRSGLQIHAQAIFFGLSSDPFVQTSLINMYSCCGSLADAERVFDEAPRPDLPSWNSIINANVRKGLMDTARQLFDEMPVRNVISWSCMINGYVRCGEFNSALALFREMQSSAVEAVRPNEFTMSAVLSACGHLGALEHGKWAHAYIDKSGIKVDNVLGTSLIDMYVKCGSIERARGVFQKLGPDKDVMAWTAMISGLGMHGHAEECLHLFLEMKEHGVKPNAVTFLALLCGCVHRGLVNEGKEWFRKMTEEFGITPGIEHYGCMVDLYGRVGLIDEAWNVVNSMHVEPDILIWGSLLSGSRTHGNVETCEIALKRLIELDPSNTSAYVLLSNVYAKLGQWNQVRSVRNLMDARGIKKVPGCSLVELDGVLHEFFVGDESHAETPQIYSMLDEIMSELKKRGYVGDTKEGLLDLDDEAQELALSVHSEKLAIAFCFLKTSPGTPIRIVKNLRICNDCHVAIKMISEVFGREIVVRDNKRFHQFANGVCSCQDFW